MKLLTGILVAALLLGGVGTGHAAVRIADDPGGRIRVYVDKYQHLRDSGEFVIIDGLCAGACTMVLGAIPRDKVCLTSNAKFGFQAVLDFDARGQTMEATQIIYLMYPSQIKRWITRQGGLTSHMIVLPGKQLLARYRSCSIADHASDSRHLTPKHQSPRAD
jgi:hypothetical protein